MNNRIVGFVSTAALIAALATAGLCYHEYELLAAMRSQFVLGELRPIATLLKENQVLLKELQAEPFAETGLGILEAYLSKIRRDGIAKHADMKQRLDTLAENNTTIVALIKAYAPHAKTSGFTTESDKFRDYASAWRDRWNSVMEIFMAGGNYAASSVQLPAGFAAAVDAEIASAKPGIFE